MNTSEVLSRIEVALDYVEFGDVAWERRLVNIIKGIKSLKADRQKLIDLYVLADTQRKEYDFDMESSEHD